MTIIDCEQETNIIKLVYSGGIKKDKGINILGFEVRDARIVVHYEKGYKIINIFEITNISVNRGDEHPHNCDATIGQLLCHNMHSKNYKKEAHEIVGNFKDEDIYEIEIYYGIEWHNCNSISACGRYNEIKTLYDLIMSKLPLYGFARKEDLPINRDFSDDNSNIEKTPKSFSKKMKEVFYFLKKKISGKKDFDLY